MGQRNDGGSLQESPALLHLATPQILERSFTTMSYIVCQTLKIMMSMLLRIVTVTKCIDPRTLYTIHTMHCRQAINSARFKALYLQLYVQWGQMPTVREHSTSEAKQTNRTYALSVSNIDQRFCFCINNFIMLIAQSLFSSCPSDLVLS